MMEHAILLVKKNSPSDPIVPQIIAAANNEVINELDGIHYCVAYMLSETVEIITVNGPEGIVDKVANALNEIFTQHSACEVVLLPPALFTNDTLHVDYETLHRILVQISNDKFNR